MVSSSSFMDVPVLLLLNVYGCKACRMDWVPVFCGFMKRKLFMDERKLDVDYLWHKSVCFSRINCQRES